MNKFLTRRRLTASVGLSAMGFGVSAATLDARNASAVQAPDGKRVTLLHFTDTHAQLETHPDYLPGANPEIQMMGGYARLKTVIERERANCKDACLLLDGGDEFQGSGPAAWSEGEVIPDRNPPKLHLFVRPRSSSGGGCLTIPFGAP